MNISAIAIDLCDASVPDAAEILAIQKLAFQGQGILYNDFRLPPLIQTLEELIQDFKTHAFLKAVHEGKIVGSVRGRVEGDTSRASSAARGGMNCSPETRARRTSRYTESSAIACIRRNLKAPTSC